MTNQTTNKGLVKKIENINDSLSYITLASLENADKEQRVPFYGNLNEKNYKGKPVTITINNSVEMPYSHIKENKPFCEKIKEQNKKPFLYSNRGMLLPDEIKVGQFITNSYDRTQMIYHTTPIGNMVYFKTIENIGDITKRHKEVHRNYGIRDNDPETLKRTGDIKVFEVEHGIKSPNSIN